MLSRQENLEGAEKEYKKAIDDYSKAIDIEPENAEYYCNRGRVYSIIGEYDKALADYGRAIELEPNNDKISEKYRSIKEKIASFSSPTGNKSAKCR